MNFNRLKNWLLTFLPILTVELTFASVPAAQGDQGDDTDEQDATSAYCSADNDHHREGFCTRGRKKRQKEGEGKMVVKRREGIR